MSDPLFAHAIEFVVSRSVRDSAVLLDQVAGPDSGGPHLIAPPSMSFAELASAPPRRARIAVMTKSFFGTEPADECAQAVAHTCALLEDLGHEIVHDHELELSWDEFLHYINMIWTSFLASGVDALGKTTGQPDPRSV
jgi:amidase